MDLMLFSIEAEMLAAMFNRLALLTLNLTETFLRPLASWLWCKSPVLLKPHS